MADITHHDPSEFAGIVSNLPSLHASSAGHFADTVVGLIGTAGLVTLYLAMFFVALNVIWIWAVWRWLDAMFKDAPWWPFTVFMLALALPFLLVMVTVVAVHQW